MIQFVQHAGIIQFVIQDGSMKKSREPVKLATQNY